MDFLNRFSSQILGITRIVAGLLFLEHGTSKLLNFPVSHTVELMSFPGGASAILELVLGALIIAGFYSRIAAFIASGEMAVAYFMAHAPRSPFPMLNGGDAAVLFCFLFLTLSAIGPGAFAANRR